MTDFSDIINFFYEMETDTFDIEENHKLAVGGEYLSAFSKNVADFDFNHVVPIGKATARGAIIAAKDEFKAHNRELVACVTPLCEDYYKKANSDLQLIATDAWMVFDTKKIGMDTGAVDIKVRVASTADIDDYIKVFFDGFSDGVYANMDSGYAKTERKSFDNPYKTKLIAFDKERPIGVVSLSIKGDMAYIESFAVLKQYRYGGEVARVLGNTALNTCYAKGVSTIFLVTAAGTVLERFYQTVGFSTKFYGYFYKWCQ